MGTSRHCRDLGGMVRKIFARRHTGLLMEHGAKILCGVEPDHTGHLVDTETAGFQQRFGFFDFYTRNKCGNLFPCFLFEQMPQIVAADVKFRRKFRNVFRNGVILLNIIDDPLDLLRLSGLQFRMLLLQKQWDCFAEPRL